MFEAVVHVSDNYNIETKESEDIMFDYSPLKENSNRERIYESAKTLYYRDGIAATSMRALASEAGVNLGSVTYFFKEKKDIETRIYAQCVNQIEEHFIPQDDGYLSLHDFFFLEIFHLRALLVSPRFHELYTDCMNTDEIRSQYLKQMAEYIRHYCNHDKNDSWFFVITPFELKGIKQELSSLYHSLPENNRPGIDRLVLNYMDAMIQTIFPPEVQGGFSDLDEYRDRLVAEANEWNINITDRFTPVLNPNSN